MNYKKFYFLHINHTISKTLGIRMFAQLYEVLEKYGIEAKSLNSKHEMHNFWREFDDDVFIFSTVREPLHFALSEFCYFVNYGTTGKRTHEMGRDRECPYFTDNNFLMWVDKYMQQNYQSRIISGWGCSHLDENINKILLDKNLSRINMLVKTECIKNNENVLRKNILHAFGIEHEFNHYPADYENVFMPFGDFSLQLQPIIDRNSNYIEKIKTFNTYDSYVYSSAESIF